MFRLFRTQQTLARQLPARVNQLNLQPRIEHRLIEAKINASIAERFCALQLIEDARNADRDHDYPTLHKILDKLSALPKYRAAALVEKGKLNLLEFDLSEAKTNFNGALFAGSVDINTRRYYLYTTFAMNGVPTFLNNAKITPLSSFSDIEDAQIPEEIFRPRPY